jgi:hypothetical protein
MWLEWKGVREEVGLRAECRRSAYGCSPARKSDHFISVRIGLKENFDTLNADKQKVKRWGSDGLGGLLFQVGGQETSVVACARVRVLR